MKIAIIGASGAIGRAMLEMMEEYQIESSEVFLYASKRSVGTKIKYKDEWLVVEELNEQVFEGKDVILGALPNALTLHYLPFIQASQAIFIDNSSALRLHDDVPLVIPEINAEAIQKHHKLIANPNCSTIIVLMALYRIHAHFTLETMNVSTYQAVSGAGVQGVEELETQLYQYMKQEAYEPKVFSQPIALNVIPQIGEIQENGYTSEEEKMQNEGRKILNHPELRVNCTCVRVPVLRSHSASVTFRVKAKTSLAQLEEVLTQAAGVCLKPQQSTPYYTSNQDDVYVERIKEDRCGEEGHSFTLWCCGDQIRKGAASNAVQILKYLIEKEN